MKEDLLHFIWKYKKLHVLDLVTSKNESVVIVDVGTHNFYAGPDFFNAKLSINDQLWAGNVEIHIKASDWYAHKHEEDANYDNVILHVVWEDDTSVFRKDGSEIPTLELKKYISQELRTDYQKLFDKSGKTFINCEADIKETDAFVFQNWLERLYFERLERKSSWVSDLLEQSNNDWEKVLFTMLLKNFGLKINADSFFSIANSIDFSVIRKVQSNSLQLESVLYGVAGFLDDDTIVDSYYLELKKEFNFLSNKFKLERQGVQKPEFFKLRPSNFPTIRLSQLASLYSKHHNIFSKIINATDLEEIYAVFKVSASDYWNTHFTFGKVSKKSSKKLTNAFIDLLVVNTILPLKFSHANHMGQDVNEALIGIISSIKKEENSIISNFKRIGVKAVSAKDSQAMLQLYNEYCTKNKCLQCVVGSGLLNGNN